MKQTNVIHLAKPDNLPNDVASLKQFIKDQEIKHKREISELKHIIEKQHKLIEQQARTIAQQNQTIEKLNHELSVLKRYVFGKRSEKTKKEKDLQENDDKNNEKPLDNDNSETITYTRKKGGKHKHHEIPDDLAVERVEYKFPDNICPCGCGAVLRVIGDQTTKVIESIPAKVFVKHHVRFKYVGCREKEGVLTAPMPGLPIDKSIAAPSLLSNVVIEKYDDHLPLYRQRERYARAGIHIPPSTINDWVHKVGQLLSPICDLFAHDIIYAFKIHTDDTTIPVRYKESKKMLTGRLWIYHSNAEDDPKIAIYQYSKNRNGEHPQKFLENFSGYLQADAYSGYDALYNREDKTITEVACWAHARRKFYDISQIEKDKNSLSHKMLKLIAKLYVIETDARNMNHKARHELRNKLAPKIIEEIYDLLIENKDSFLPKSPVNKAIQYALNQWKALNNYLLDGRLDIDNNAAERLMRIPVLGRRNWLFIGNENAAHNVAILYSIIETAKLNGLNPLTYLTDVLTKIADHPASRIRELLPYSWSPPEKT